MVIYGKGAKTLATDIHNEAIQTKENELFMLRKMLAEAVIVKNEKDTDDEALRLLETYSRRKEG